MRHSHHGEPMTSSSDSARLYKISIRLPISPSLGHKAR
jgi:hypothetical protein